MQPMEQHHQGKTGLEFFEGFALMAGALWLAGALLAGSMAMMGNARISEPPAASNQTPIANSPETE